MYPSLRYPMKRVKTSTYLSHQQAPYTPLTPSTPATPLQYYLLAHNQDHLPLVFVNSFDSQTYSKIYFENTLCS